jgi:hypothetical protein
MSNQNSSGDDGNRDDGSRTDNGNSEYPEELNHIHDAFEGIAQILDGLVREDPGLRAFVEQQDGNIDSLPEQQGGEQQGGNVNSLPSEDHTATVGGIEPDLWQLEAEALANRVQAVIVYFLQRMNNAEVSEMLEMGMKGGIAPNPNTPLETKVHTKRMKKRRPSGLIYNKEPSEEAQEACNTAICF